jgi:acyl dehydratase
VTVTQEEILEFAHRYDPQPIHVDPEAAARGPYGGIIASGWHTCSLVMRQLVEHYVSAASALGSPGIDELRWLLPVRPGDRLTVDVEVVEARVSRSKPDRGIVRTRIQVTNQSGAAVLRMLAANLILTRQGARQVEGVTPQG